MSKAGKKPGRTTATCQRVKMAVGGRSRIHAGILATVLSASCDMALAQATDRAAASQAQEEQAGNWLDAQIRRFRSYPHLDRAYRYLEQNKPRGAAEEMRVYLGIHPSDLGVRTGYLHVLYRLGETNELERQVDMVLKQQPESVIALLYRGLVAQKKGRSDIALASFRRVYLHPAAAREDRVFAAGAAAEAGLSTRRYAEALAALDVLAAIENSFLAQMRRGYALSMLDKVDDAERSYQAAARLARNDGERVQAESALGYLAQKYGKEDAAILHGEAVLARDPGNLDWIRTLAHLYYFKKNFPLSERMAQRAADISNDLKDRMYLANVLAARRSFAAAAEQYARVAAEAREPRLAYRAGMGAGYAHQALGNLKQAQAAFAGAVRTDSTREARLALAATSPGADSLPALLQQYRKEPTALAAASIAYLYARDNNHAQAVAYFELALKGSANPEWALALAAQYAGIGDSDKALAALQHALGPDVRADLRGPALRQAGYIHAQTGDYRKAIEAFTTAIGLRDGDLSLRKELAYLLIKNEQYDEALAQFLWVLERERTASNMLAVARTYAAMKQPEPALQYYRLADADARGLGKEELAAMEAEIGYLYADKGKFVEARNYWIKAAELHDTGEIQISLVNAESMLGMTTEALARLDALSGKEINGERRPAILDQYAALHDKIGNSAEAARYTELALAVAPTARRHFQMALHALKTGNMQLTRSHLEKAVEMDPDNNDFRQQLAYACKEQGDVARAIRLFEEVVRRDPARTMLYQEIAYVYAEAGDNDKAITWFRKAIDEKLKEGLAQNGRSDDREIYAMRQQVREMGRRYRFNAYQTYRPGARGTSSVTPGFATGGLVPSQGGVEVIYQPPGIGYRKGRTLRFFGRALWSNKPESLALDSRTVQGGLGVEYKPLRDVNAYVSLERLVRIGEQTENNWLLRASWGYSDGYDLRPNVRSWNQTILYADAGYFLQRDKVQSVYLEARQGRTFNFSNTTMVTPHVTLAGRGQRPDPSGVSYLEVGAGLSVKFLFNETRYEAARSSGEFIVQYRKPVANSQRTGSWVMTAVFQF